LRLFFVSNRDTPGFRISRGNTPYKLQKGTASHSPPLHQRQHSPKITTGIHNYQHAIGYIWAKPHRSIPAPPSPQANPQALLFFLLGGKFPGVGTLKLPNASQWGRRKRANAPPLGSYVPNQHCSSFHSLHNSGQ